MYSFSELAKALPEVKQSRMVAGGIGLWLVWSREPSQALEQMLREHGGLLMATAKGQAFWYFFDKDALRATARLQIWARLNPMRLTIQAFPASMLVGWDLTLTASVPGDISSQQVLDPGEFEILVHPKVKSQAESIPGLHLHDVKAYSGLASVEWKALQADPSFSYESKLEWFFIVKPLGNKLDKDFITGWRHFMNAAEPVLSRHRLRYLQGEASLILPMNDLHTLASWCKEAVGLVRGIKSDENGVYWPCVMAAVRAGDKKLTEDLPKRINLDWDRLTPDYPHMHFRDAFLLGEGFQINQIGYFNEHAGVENWCYVSIASDAEDGAGQGVLQVDLPRRLMSGRYETCFYCGLKNHPPRDCPSKTIEGFNPALWKKLAHVDLDKFNEMAGKVNDALDDDSTEGLVKLLAGKGAAALYAKCLFENGWHLQTRMFRALWRCRSKDWRGAFDQLGPKEGDFFWDGIEYLEKGDLAAVEQAVNQASQRYPRGFQPRSLQALLDLERGDMGQALFYFQEAERLSITPVQRSVFFMLQGRVFETSGDYEKAIATYKRAQAHTPGWLDTVYRQGVSLVKMGFTQHAVSVFGDLIGRDPNIFNRLLLDPEIERGRFQVLGYLWQVWSRAQERADESRARLKELEDKLAKWFDEDHEYMDYARKRLDRLHGLSRVENYVALVELEKGCPELEEQFKERIDKELRGLDKKVDSLVQGLKEVQREAAWFPFPKLLREFNRDFNYCAEKINWMKSQPLKVAENFRKAHGYITQVEERITMLKNRLISLKVIRDSTLFVMLLGRNFVWMELLGLGLALVLVPLTVYLSQHWFSDWAATLVVKQKWQLQKGLIIILSIGALAVSVLKTAIVFDRKKDKIFEKEYQKSLGKAKARKAKAGKRRKSAARG